MARGLKVQWSTSARRDIRHIVEYIGARRPAAAQRIVAELREAVEHARQQPEMGPKFERLADEGNYRGLMVEGYWVIYTVERDLMSIVRVWDARRDPGSLRLS